MDAQHRHELKTNELADWLGHLPQFLKDNSNTIIGIALICIALITWPMLSKKSKQKEMNQQIEMTQSIQMLSQDVANVLQTDADDLSLRQEALATMLVNADELLSKASDIDNPNLAAMAQIKAGQAIRTQLHLQKSLDTETLETQFAKAKEAYQTAFETANTPTLKAMAMLGLGLCSEELGQADQAGEIYQQIIDNEDYQATVLPAQAQKRLDDLDENAESFIFAEVPFAAEEQTDATTDQGAVTDMNITTDEETTPPETPEDTEQPEEVSGQADQPKTTE